MVKEESSLPWEAKALDGLELPACAHHTLKVYEDGSRPPERFLPPSCFSRARGVSVLRPIVTKSPKRMTQSVPRFLRCGPGLFRRRNANLFAASLILRFSQTMNHAINAASKLCASMTRHAQVMRLSAACLRSTWQGGGNPLRCILPRCRTRHAETLPVSTPSGWRRPAACPSCAVRP